MDYTKDVHEMCEIRAQELSEANEKIRQAGGKMSGSDLDYVDKLTHAIKSIKTTIAMMEADEGTSGRMYPYYGGSYNDGSYDNVGSYRGRSSYARGRMNTRRDSMGRYSGDDNMVAELRELMQDAPDEQTRKEFERFIQKIERM